MPKLISEILDLPERVRKGDFVLNLSKGVTEPEKTLAQYVVTPQLVASFEDALGFIKSAVDAGNSKACYLHGSFGSGKSHFMAVLHLLLQHNTAVRSIPELAQVCNNNRWVEDKNFLLVPYHMIGSRNMESAILGGYVHYVQSQHPDAPLPGVYLADEIFENAQQLRERLGDDTFFEDLNKGSSGARSGGWGKLEGWDAARFDAALAAPPKSRERSQLVGKLVEFTHADAGQMHMSLNYAAEHWTHEDENPPVGLILCARHDESVARYTLDNLPNKVMAREYKLALPDEELLIQELERTQRLLEHRESNTED
ncbi:MAG: PDDEXK nuclease domain-containing protein [bacterium]